MLHRLQVMANYWSNFS